MGTQFKDAFVQQIMQQFPDEAEQLLAALKTEPSIAIRVNRRKNANLPRTNPVPWCSCGCYLDHRQPFTFDPLLHAGLYYVQDASSMFLHHVLTMLAHEDITYLDLCAAPGGKSTAAIDALSPDSLVVCNEIDGQRAQILRENVTKWGCPNCMVTNDNAKNFGKLKNFFNIIAADMPCSGEGMFRKDEEAVAQWSPSLVAQCAQRQQEIVDDIWQALKPGGFFIYSTCTFNRLENEDMVAYIAENYEAESVEIPVEPSWNIRKGINTPYHCYRFLPHRTQGEGLFMSVLRKTGECGKIRPFKPKGKTKPKQSVSNECKSFLANPEKFVLELSENNISAMPVALAEQMQTLCKNVRTLCYGIPLATVKGKDIVPEHALSQSIAISTTAFPKQEITYKEAIAFLRGENVIAGNGQPRGYMIVAYQGIPLGFMKNLGNRANNLYPKEWRIRSSYLPEQAPEIIALSKTE